MGEKPPRKTFCFGRDLFRLSEGAVSRGESDHRTSRAIGKGTRSSTARFTSHHHHHRHVARSFVRRAAMRPMSPILPGQHPSIRSLDRTQEKTSGTEEMGEHRCSSGSSTKPKDRKHRGSDWSIDSIGDGRLGLNAEGNEAHPATQSREAQH